MIRAGAVRTAVDVEHKHPTSLVLNSYRSASPPVGPRSSSTKSGSRVAIEVDIVASMPGSQRTVWSSCTLSKAVSASPAQITVLDHV